MYVLMVGIVGLLIILVLVGGSIAEKIAWAMGKRRLAKWLKRWTPFFGVCCMIGLILVSIGILVHGVMTH